MKRELSYREEMVQQLHIVRGEKNKAEGAETAARRRAFSPRAVDLRICWSMCGEVIDVGLYA